MRCKCGFENAADARFCGSCRSPLGQVPGSAGPGASVLPTPLPVRVGVGKAGAKPFSRTRMAILAAVVVIAAAGYWWLNRPPERYKADNGGLYPINVNGKYGYMDRSGKTAITPQFEFAGRFSEGLAMVRIGTKAGYINSQGTVVITPQFEPLFSSDSEFRYGRARVVVGNRVGFIDKDGKYIHSPDFQQASPFSGDLAPVVTAAGEAAFVDRSGKVVMSGNFQYAGQFTAGLAPAQSGGKWGYIDATGKWAIDPQFERARNFADGLAAVSVGGRTGYIDKRGKFVVNPQYDSGGEFHEGYASVGTGGVYVFIDTNGRIVIDQKFQRTRDFGEGLAPVKTEDGWGFIDRTGQMVVKPQFDFADEFQNGLAQVRIDGKEAYITTAGAFVIDPFPGRTAIDANQSRAIGSLRTLNNAEIAYSSTYNVGFSQSIAYLAPPPTAGANLTSTSAGLIENSLAGGSRNGYTFVYSPGASDSSSRINTYSLIASPISSSTGTSSYYTDQSGVIRENQNGPAGPSSPPLGSSQQSIPVPARGGQSAAPQGQPTTVPEDIGRFLQTWGDSFRTGNFDVQMDCYAPVLESYYGKPNLTRANVRREREGMVAQYGAVRQFDVSNVELTSSSPGRAEVTFRTHWELSGKGYFAGEDTEKLTLIQTDGRWLIAGEEEPVVYWVKKQAREH